MLLTDEQWMKRWSEKQARARKDRCLAGLSAKRDGLTSLVRRDYCLGQCRVVPTGVSTKGCAGEVLGAEIEMQIDVWALV